MSNNEYDEQASYDLDIDLLEVESEPEPQRFIVEATEASMRLDRFLVEHVPDLSRSYIQRLIADGRVTINNRVETSPGSRLRANVTVELRVPPPAPLDLIPEDIPLTVVYEDNDLIVIDKPAGIVVHPSAGHASGTLVHAILNHAPDVELNGTLRPGIVHRLDKDTSGLLMVAKTNIAQASLAEQIKQHKVVKEYVALVLGHVGPDRGVIEAPIGRDPKNRKMMAIVDVERGGKQARTHFSVRERLGGGQRPAYTLLDLRLETGRTHQIRVHLSAINHPIIGDPVYGKPGLGLTRQFLHAIRLVVALPSTGEHREFRSVLPQDLEAALTKARAEL